MVVRCFILLGGAYEKVCKEVSRLRQAQALRERGERMRLFRWFIEWFFREPETPELKDWEKLRNAEYLDEKEVKTREANSNK